MSTKQRDSHYYEALAAKFEAGARSMARANRLIKSLDRRGLLAEGYDAGHIEELISNGGFPKALIDSGLRDAERYREKANNT